MKRKIYTTVLFLSVITLTVAQHPLKNSYDAIEIRYDRRQPVISYILAVDSADLSAINVEMSIHNIPDTFKIAMVAHPEYDDKYWRFVEDLHVETKNGKGDIKREDSALWRVEANGGAATISYRIHLPPEQRALRAAWRPFLSSTGGLVGGVHSFMYVVSATLAPAYVTLRIPHGWNAVTGLEPTSDPYTFFAPSVGILVDGPILIGKFKKWDFQVHGVPHIVAYWSLPNAVPFDSSNLVTGIQKIVEQAFDLFGRLPYREYFFLLQDGATGALEHCNSVTLGALSSDLSNDFTEYISEIAHEYFHLWNLMRIHPIEFGDVGYHTPKLSRGLWWSEGLTMFYADLLQRRAHLDVHDTSRIQHLEKLITRYYGSPGNSRISAEEVSLAADGPPGMLGDYNASTHLQGELIGVILDLMIRDETNGRHSIDDVMRKMMERYSGEKGFISSDIERLITELFGCDTHSFFTDHIRGNKSIDFNKYLRLIGLRFTMSWKNVLDSNGKQIPDPRVYAWQRPNEMAVTVGIMEPNSCWGKAGLHIGDKIISINKKPIHSREDFWQTIRTLHMGDNLLMELETISGPKQITVVVSGYKQPELHIEQLQESSEKQKKLLVQWMSGD